MTMEARRLHLAEAISVTRIRTLVVDDSPFMLKVLAQILKRAGNFDLVGTATDGCQALRYVSTLSPDLVLMDAYPPHLNGIQATRYIKDREHPPVVIIVSSDDSSVAKATAEEAGADGFVIKWGNLQHRLIGALHDLLGPNGVRRGETRKTVNETPSEKSLPNFATHERFDSALGIMRFRQPILAMPLRHAEHPLWEAHSALKRDARVVSSTLPAAPPARQSLVSTTHSRNCALPYEFSPRERRALRHTTP